MITSEFQRQTISECLFNLYTDNLSGRLFEDQNVRCYNFVVVANYMFTSISAAGTNLLLQFQQDGEF